MDEITNAEVTESSAESAQDGIEQAQSEESTVMALSSLVGESEEGEQPQDADQQTEEVEAPKAVSGGIKGRLLESEKKGYNKGREAAMAEWNTEKSKMQADYEAAMQELNEYKVEKMAAKIAKDEGCSMALATRLARMELGLPAQVADGTAQARDPATGRFTAAPKEQPTQDANARAQELFTQAQTIKRATGFDAMALFQSDPEVQKAVLSGQKDFADIAKEYGQKQTKRTPSPIRSSGDGKVVARSFKDMTDAQFDEIQAKLQQGYAIDLRK